MDLQLNWQRLSPILPQWQRFIAKEILVKRLNPLLPENFKEHIVSIRDDFLASFNIWRNYVKDTWPLLAILLALTIGAIWIAEPAPPKKIVMASGTPGGSYEALARKYQAFLKSYGIEVKIVSSEGPMQNLAWLAGNEKSPEKIDVALTQAGLAEGLPNIDKLIYLGSIDYEPIFFILRSDLLSQITPNVVGSFASLRVGVGSPGSGTKTQFERLLKLDGVQGERKNLIHVEDKTAAQSLTANELEGLVLVDGIESKNLHKLANAPDLTLLDFPRAEAYHRRLPYLSVLQIPEGAINLAKNIPDSDLDLLSTTTALIAQKDLHPAIQFLLMKAAHSINGVGGFFAEPNLFPKFVDSSIPRSDVAAEYYEKGSPYLQRHLPFWLAELIDRLILVVMPFAALAYPIIISLPKFRLRRMNRRIWSGYTKLKELELEITYGYDPDKHPEYLQELEEIEHQAIKLRIYGSVGADYFRLRQHIHFVRDLLQRLHARSGFS